MVSILKIWILGLCFGVAVACSSSTKVEHNTAVSNDPIINVDSSKSDDISSRLQYLTALNIDLPQSWQLDMSQKVVFNFINELGEEGGYISTAPYDESFDFPKPNHSSVVKDEYINISFGKCRLITLDADNGTAASGLIGTHNEYYAIVPVKNKLNFIVNFNKKDKEEQSKEQFIEILNSLSFK